MSPWMILALMVSVNELPVVCLKPNASIVVFTGDDTAHIPIPDFPLPAFVGSSLPSDTTDNDLIDVVYLDFFDKQLRTLLFDLSGKNWTANMEYGDTNVTSSTMWIRFAQTYWNTTLAC